MKKVFLSAIAFLCLSAYADDNSNIHLTPGTKLNLSVISDIQLSKSEKYAELLFDIKNKNLEQCIIAATVSVNKSNSRLDVKIENLICAKKNGAISDRNIQGKIIGHDNLEGIKINKIITDENGLTKISLNQQTATMVLFKNITISK